VNGSALEPVPSESVTETAPVVAPTGTVAVIWMVESTVNVAEVPLKLTALTVLVSSKAKPVIVTEVPDAPLSGRKAATVGASACAGATPTVGIAKATSSMSTPTRFRRRRPDPSMTASSLPWSRDLWRFGKTVDLSEGVIG
jgi:hypothetical protein